MTNQTDKPVIIFVDHEKPSLKEVIGGIGKPKLTMSTMKPVRESCELISVFVKDTPRDTLITRAIKNIEQANPRPDLILVDLSFDNESRESKSVEYGRSLALGLKEHFKLTAVGVYSKYPLYPRDRALTSAEGFALVLEDVRNMYDEKSSYALNGDAWLGLFQKAIRSIRTHVTPPHALSTSEPKSRWADGHPAHRSLSFLEAAPKLTDKSLEWISDPPDQIIIEELGGGFSGAYVVKATLPDREATFVIKIDEDPEKLEKELKGYQIFQSRVEHNYYLTLMGPGINWPVKLYADWWGAFAMPFEGNAKPLLQYYSHSHDEPLHSIYERLWTECLFKLYGTASTEELQVSDIIRNSDWEMADKGRKAIERYNFRMQELDEAHRQDIDSITSVIGNLKAEEIAASASLNVPWVQQIHGDLNCRNILYDEKNKSLRLIDFPNVGPNCLAVDFVKAEAELVLIMLDWGTGRDCDIPQVNSWGDMTRTISVDFTRSDSTSKDAEAQRTLSSIDSIRTKYASYADDSTSAREAYRLYLLAKVLRYISYSDLTIAKRFLALIWAGQLARARWKGTEILASPDMTI